MTASTTTAEGETTGRPEAPAAAAVDEPEGVLHETDSAATEMAYDEGKVPWYITLTWVGFLALLVSYVVIYYVPDLRAWLELPPP